MFKLDLHPADKLPEGYGYKQAPHVKKFSSKTAGPMPDGIIILNSGLPYNDDTQDFQKTMFKYNHTYHGWCDTTPIMDLIKNIFAMSMIDQPNDMALDNMRDVLSAFAGVCHPKNSQTWGPLALHQWLSIIRSYNNMSGMNLDECMAAVYSMVTQKLWKSTILPVNFGGRHSYFQSVIYDTSLYTEKDIHAERYSKLHLQSKILFNVAYPMMVFDVTTDPCSDSEKSVLEAWAFRKYKKDYNPISGYLSKFNIGIPFDGFFADNISLMDSIGTEEAFVTDRTARHNMIDYLSCHAGAAIGCSWTLISCPEETLIEVLGELYRLAQRFYLPKTK